MMKRIIRFALVGVVSPIPEIAARRLANVEKSTAGPDRLLGSSPKTPQGSATVRYSGTSALRLSGERSYWMADGWSSQFEGLERRFSELGGSGIVWIRAY